MYLCSLRGLLGAVDRCDHSLGDALARNQGAVDGGLHSVGVTAIGGADGHSATARIRSGYTTVAAAGSIDPLRTCGTGQRGRSNRSDRETRKQLALHWTESSPLIGVPRRERGDGYPPWGP